MGSGGGWFVVGPDRVVVAMVMAYPQLPDTSDLADYRPKVTLDSTPADGAAGDGRVGERRAPQPHTHRRHPASVMKDAVLLQSKMRAFISTEV
jgi:penicillin-binding protein 1A